MIKTILIDDREVTLKTNGALPLVYKAQFGKDFFAEIGKLSKVNSKKLDFNTLEFEFFYNVIWIMAKSANKDIAPPMEWFAEFDSFPIIEIIPEIQDMLMSSLQSKKK